MKRITIIGIIGLLLLSAKVAFSSPAFDYIEIFSDNRVDEWRLRTYVMVSDVSGPPITSAQYSWDGTNFYNLSGETWGWYSFFADMVHETSGLPPTDLNGSRFTWQVDDPSGFIEASATAYGIRNVPLTTDLRVVSGGANPTISWHNDDTSFDVYSVRVLDSTGDLLWASNELEYSVYGNDPTYKIEDFNFLPGVDYYIRVEVRDYLDFFDMEGDPVSWAKISNRSTVHIEYNFTKKALPFIPLLLFDQ